MNQAERLFTGKDDQIGKLFGIKVSGHWTRGMFQGMNIAKGYGPNSKSRTRYNFLNMKTNREVVLKSRVKIAGMLDNPSEQVGN